MILDYNAQFSDAQTLVAASLIFPATYDIDCESGVSDLGAGTPIWVVCKVNTVCAGLATISVALQDSAAGSTYVTRYTTYAYSLGQVDAVGNTLLSMPLPADHARYLRLLYTITTSATAGAVDAFLCNAPPRDSSLGA